MSLCLYFIMAVKDCESSATVTFIFNMFVVYGMDRGLVLMISYDTLFTSSFNIVYVYVILYCSRAKMIFLIDLS